MKGDPSCVVVSGSALRAAAGELAFVESELNNVVAVLSRAGRPDYDPAVHGDAGLNGIWSVGAIDEIVKHLRAAAKALTDDGVLDGHRVELPQGLVFVKFGGDGPRERFVDSLKRRRRNEKQ